MLRLLRVFKTWFSPGSGIKVSDMDFLVQPRAEQRFCCSGHQMPTWPEHHLGLQNLASGWHSRLLSTERAQGFVSRMYEGLRAPRQLLFRHLHAKRAVFLSDNEFPSNLSVSDNGPFRAYHRKMRAVEAVSERLQAVRRAEMFAAEHRPDQLRERKSTTGCELLHLIGYGFARECTNAGIVSGFCW